MEGKIKKLTFDIDKEIFCEFFGDEIICKDKPFDLMDLVMEARREDNKGRVIELVGKGGYSVWVRRLKEDYDHAIDLLEERGF